MSSLNLNSKVVLKDQNLVQAPNGDVLYMNSGDWVESLSALTEDENGEWNLVYYSETEKTGLHSTTAHSALDLHSLSAERYTIAYKLMELELAPPCRLFDAA